MPIILPSKFKIVTAASAAASSVTGTTSDTTLFTFPLPAGTVGPNGAIQIIVGFSYTNSGNNKTLRVKIGGTNFAAVVVTTTAAMVRNMVVYNVNSQAVQTEWTSTIAAGFGVTTNALTSGAKDLSVAQDITVSGQLASSGETITMEYVLINIMKQFST